MPTEANTRMAAVGVPYTVYDPEELTGTSPSMWTPVITCPPGASSRRTFSG